MSNKITNEDIEKAAIKLKPVFGIKPGIYLTIIYGTIVLIVLFLLLFAPGLKNNGVRVNAKTLPSGAAVYVDDIYMGTTPVTFFSKKGERSFRIEKKYFKTVQFTENIGGRIFASLFFPRKFNINQKINLVDPEEFLSKRFNELSSYALIDNYYDHYQMPPLISQTVNEYISGINSDNYKPLSDFLYAMRVNLGSPDMVKDYVKAISLAGKGNNTESEESPAELKIIFDYFADENNNNGLMYSILKAYPKDDRKTILESLSDILNPNEILNNSYTFFKNNKELKEPGPNGKTIVVNTNRFIGFSSGKYLSGEKLPENPEQLLDDTILSSFPHLEYVSDFYIMDRHITRGQYSLFLDENPSWRSDNISNLIKNNLANKDYLAFQDFSDKSTPIANISWYAATAYCEWLESKLPDNMSSGYTVKLPSEREWEAAARFDVSGTTNYVFRDSDSKSALPIDFSRAGNAGLYDIKGNLWEWNDNWYFPTDSENGSFGLGKRKFEGVEKAVRGGSWANSKEEIDIHTRGSQDPKWCTPFLGFRPVLVKK